MRRPRLDWEMALPGYRSLVHLIRPRGGAMLTHGITVLPTIPSVGDDAWNARNHARPAAGFLESGAA
jgi:hypothetical protein